MNKKTKTIVYSICGGFAFLIICAIVAFIASPDELNEAWATAGNTSTQVNVTTQISDSTSKVEATYKFYNDSTRKIPLLKSGSSTDALEELKSIKDRLSPEVSEYLQLSNDKTITQEQSDAYQSIKNGLYGFLSGVVEPLIEYYSGNTTTYPDYISKMNSASGYIESGYKALSN